MQLQKRYQLSLHLLHKFIIINDPHMRDPAFDIGEEFYLIVIVHTIKDEETKKELNLEHVASVVITEDNSHETVYDDTEIKIVNLKEWLLKL